MLKQSLLQYIKHYCALHVSCLKGVGNGQLGCHYIN